MSYNAKVYCTHHASMHCPAYQPHGQPVSHQHTLLQQRLRNGRTSNVTIQGIYHASMHCLTYEPHGQPVRRQHELLQQRLAINERAALHMVPCMLPAMLVVVVARCWIEHSLSAGAACLVQCSCQLPVGARHEI